MTNDQPQWATLPREKPAIARRLWFLLQSLLHLLARLVAGVTRVQATEDKIRKFADLGEGWNYGEGINFRQSVLDDAISLNRRAIALGFSETDAFPGVNGGIMVTVYHHDHYLEFIIEPDGMITFCQEKRSKEISYQEELSLEEAIEAIPKISEKRSWFPRLVRSVTALAESRPEGEC